MICRVLGDACETPQAASPPEDVTAGARPDAYYRPENCLVRSSSDQASSSVKIAFIECGEDFGFVREEMSDGTVSLTLTDGASLGAVAAAPGARFELGKLGDGSGGGKVEVEVGAGLKFGYGDTWVFDSPEEAARFRDDITELHAREISMRHNPTACLGFWVTDLVDGESPEVPDPSVTFSRLELEGRFTAALGLDATPAGGGDGDAVPLQTGASFEAKVGGDVYYHEYDRETGWHTYPYSLVGSVEADATAGTMQAGGSAEREGAMKVVRDESGQVVEVQFLQTTGASTSIGSEASVPVSADASAGATSGDSTSRVDVVHTTLPVDDEEERRVVEDWLSGENDDSSPTRLMWDDLVPHTPARDDPLARLMHAEASTTRLGYD